MEVLAGVPASGQDAAWSDGRKTPGETATTTHARNTLAVTPGVGVHSNGEANLLVDVSAIGVRASCSERPGEKKVAQLA